MRPIECLVSLSVLVAAFSSASAVSRPAKRSYATHDYYVLEHDPSVGISVEDCAGALGAEVIEQAGELRDHWLVRAQKPSDAAEDRVLDAFRSLQSQSSAATPYEKRSSIPFAVKHVSRQVPRQRIKRAAIPAPPPPGLADEAAHPLSRDIAERLGILDPLFSDQWHLVNEDYPEHMTNATPVWDMGIMGEGVISALVDDGLDFESDDLADNFDAAGSHDFNLHVDLPKPMLWDDHHGTRCAGQIAAVKNGVCGVGIAYKSKVAGIRILSGPISDVDEAAALNFAYQNTSIYSCSWGPADDGESMEAPNVLIQKAILNGVQNGRGGKGSVYVFASGNGAYAGDQCNFDGYTNSIYSVTVAAIDYKGEHPYYSEACAANMVVTYSSGTEQKRQIVTTDIGKNKCTEGHGGTSAAAPNAVGIFALALSVRPDLSWRDVQHLCVQSAQIVNPSDLEWELTATGRPYHYKYGFGKLDAYDFVTAAQQWQLVKPQAWIELPAVQIGEGTMDKDGKFAGGRHIGKDGVTSDIEITQKIMEENNFQALEHVTVTVWIQHTRRGDVEVELTSPHGVKSVLAQSRSKDRDPDGFQGWRFMSVKHWGEDPIGKWMIKVSDQDNENEHGYFIGWTMSFWGSVIDANKAKPYVITRVDEMPFPPPEPSHPVEIVTTSASTTKSYMKPTIISTHSDSSESTKPVQEDIVSTTQVEEVAQPTPTEGEGDSNSGGDEMDDATRFWIGVVGYTTFVFLLGGGIFLIVRRIRRRRQQGAYVAISREEGLDPSSSSGRRSQVDVIYDADEETTMTSVSKQDVSSGQVGFHSGFLDDDEQATPSAPRVYSDAPNELDRQQETAALIPRSS